MVNVHAAKSNLSKLLEKVENGEDVVIARAGKPVARLVSYEEEQKPRKFGMLKGAIKIADDFDAPLSNDFFGL